MARKDRTELTYRVKLTLPTGVNASQMQQFVRDALTKQPLFIEGEDAMFIHPEDFTVALMEKRTTYA